RNEDLVPGLNPQCRRGYVESRRAGGCCNGMARLCHAGEFVLEPLHELPLHDPAGLQWLLDDRKIGFVKNCLRYRDHCVLRVMPELARREMSCTTTRSKGVTRLGGVGSGPRRSAPAVGS